MKTSRSTPVAATQDWFLVYGYSSPTASQCSGSDTDFPFYIRGVRAERCLPSETDGIYVQIHCSGGQAMLSTFASETCSADSLQSATQALGCFPGERSDAYVALPTSITHTMVAPKITSRHYSCAKVSPSTNPLTNVPLPKSPYFASIFASDPTCQDAVAFDAFSFPQVMNSTKCQPCTNLQPADVKSEHFGMIRYDYIYTQVNEGDMSLPVPQSAVHPLYSPAVGVLLSLLFCACVASVLYLLCNDKHRLMWMQQAERGQHQALPTDSEHPSASSDTEVATRNVMLLTAHEDA